MNLREEGAGSNSPVFDYNRVIELISRLHLSARYLELTLYAARELMPGVSCPLVFQEKDVCPIVLSHRILPWTEEDIATIVKLVAPAGQANHNSTSLGEVAFYHLLNHHRKILCDKFPVTAHACAMTKGPAHHDKIAPFGQFLDVGIDNAPIRQVAEYQLASRILCLLVQILVWLLSQTSGPAPGENSENRHGDN